MAQPQPQIGEMYEDRSVSAVEAWGGRSNVLSAFVVAVFAAGIVLAVVFLLTGRNNPSPLHPAPSPTPPAHMVRPGH